MQKRSNSDRDRDRDVITCIAFYTPRRPKAALSYSSELHSYTMVHEFNHHRIIIGSRRCHLFFGRPRHATAYPRSSSAARAATPPPRQTLVASAGPGPSTPPSARQRPPASRRPCPASDRSSRRPPAGDPPTEPAPRLTWRASKALRVRFEDGRMNGG